MAGSLAKGGLLGAIGGAAGGSIIAIMSADFFWLKMGYYTVDEATKVLGPPKVWTPEMLLAMVIAVIAYNTFWGVILGLIYSRTYDVIPSKGIMKGLIFSMVAYLIANIRAAQIFASFGQYTVVKVVSILPYGLIYFIIFGIIVGYFYKK